MEFFQQLAVSWAIVLAFFFAWTGLIYGFFRFSRAETEERFREFLEKFAEFFAFRIVGEEPREITAKVMRKAGARVGGFMAFAATGLFLDSTASRTTRLFLDLKWYMVLLAAMLVFFDGLRIAASWYGQRCLRRLGIESFRRESA